MRKSNQKGVTLVEILIAMFILGFALLAMGTYIGLAMKIGTKNKQFTTGTQLLMDKFETVKNTPFVQVTSGNDTVVKMGTTFQRTWMVTPNDNIKTVSVVVSWTGKSIFGNTVVSQ
jgi:prepilin-type N-terminal cleavage/methylation domain-containing protein